MQLKINKNIFLLGLLLLVAGILGVIKLLDSQNVSAADRLKNSPSASQGQPYSSEVRIRVTPNGIEPAKITIPAGVDVKLFAENSGAAGCATNLVSKGLFEGYIEMGIIGDTQEKVIHAERPGSYKISCTMGHYNLEVQAI